MTSESTSLLLSDSCSPYLGQKKRNAWSLEETESLSLFTAENPNIQTAAFLLRDAILLAKSTSSFAHTDVFVSVNKPETLSSYSTATSSHKSRFFRRILTSSLVRAFLRLCMVGIVLLSFVEPPSWCRDFQGGDGGGDVGGGGSCKAAMSAQGIPAFYSDSSSEVKIQPYYPNTGTVWFTEEQSIKIECFLVGMFLLHTLLCLAADDFSIENFFYIGVLRLELDTVSARRIRNASIFRWVRVLTLCLLVKGILSFSLMSNPERPFAVFLRMILFITYSEGLQSEIMTVMEILPALFSVGLVLSMVIAFFGLVGVAAFYNTSEGSEHFSNLIEALWSLFTSMTTVIYPDVMMAGYNENRFVALFFVIYMILVFFFFQNVILGYICNIYKNRHDAKDAELEKAREDYCRKAFDVLTSGDVEYVTRQQLMGVFMILNQECDEIGAVEEERAELIFAILDKDGSEKLELNEFLYFGQAMLLEFEEFANYKSFVEKYFPALLESEFYKNLKQVVHSDWFERSVDVMVTINAFVVLVHSYPMLAGKSFQDNLDYAEIDSPWEVVEVIFTIIFAFEMTSKIAVLGFKRYFSSLRNIFDGSVTTSAIISAFYTCFTSNDRTSHLTRFIIMARVFRILRFFVVVKQFNAMSKTFYGILPAASRVALLLFCVIYTWSWIGIYFFGGLITRDPNNPTSYLLEGTDFADAFYWANNFNDMLSGANVCFNLLVINNWNEMESGIVAVAQTKLSRFYFLTFYIMGVMIVNNLVIALVIGYFLDEFESDNDEVDDVFESGRELVFDSDQMPTPKEFGKYVARLNPKYRLTAMKSKKVLKQLFSQRVRGREI
eukprot:CAMPEP_0176506338 /NCGR_PEP_ID=MMETSP0200_2-20121128/16977_1 /TAXON_ID=947934 /ORGANISM="Chaetoceros sp., Strain GSL56" /LENGTH=835 /DNA_ID=CAMNT_0017905957 /DNA_START=250 /DNA_END=2757 /DNA_ORIENTATION=+